jgi:serine protease Do
MTTRPHSLALVAVTAMLACSTSTTNRERDAGGDAGSAAPERYAVTITAIDDLEAAFKRAIAAAGPAVVSIYTTRTRAVPRADPRFERLFGAPGHPREYTQRGLGSGFLLDAEGHIVTNNHVIVGADEIRIKLADEREFIAELVGSDAPTDLAVLKITAEDLQPVVLGDSDNLEVGDWVLVIGDAYGLPQTVSAGIVSAKGRADLGIIDFEDFIQTDAAVNPGNSGGPLVDLGGRVVGISVAIASRGGGSEGIAFAIPINMAKVVVEQLRREGEVRRGQLGVVISPLSADLAESFGFAEGVGILIEDVVRGSAAERAGLRDGDIITKLDGEPAIEVSRFRNAIASKPPGATVTLEVFRAGRFVQIDAVLGEVPRELPREVSERPELGVVLEDVTPALARQFGLPEPAGVVVMAVAPRSLAESVGLRPGDLLVQIGTERVTSAAQASRLLDDVDLRKGVRLRVQRDGVGRYLYIKGGS